MSEWGMDPGTIIRTWTMDQLLLYADKLFARKKAEADVFSGKGAGAGDKVVDYKTLMAEAGNPVKGV